MKKTKNKITPSVRDLVYQTASKLPPMGKVVNGQPVYKYTTVSGSELSQKDIMPGQKIMLNATYRVKRLVYEDHVTNLFNAFIRDGEKGILDYKGAIEAQVAAYKRADAAEKSLSNKFFNKLYKFISWVKKRTSR